MDLKREAEEHAVIANNQANALLALQNAMATVVAEETDPDIKSGLTAQAKRQLMDIISPVKGDDTSKKPKLDMPAKMKLDEELAAAETEPDKVRYK